MDEQQFDNQLKKHIRAVFDNFEAPAADEGWLLLREKYPEKKKHRGITWIWLGTAAAILVLLLGIGTWINLQKDAPIKLAVKPVKAMHDENRLTKRSSPINKETAASSQLSSSVAKANVLSKRPQYASSKGLSATAKQLSSTSSKGLSATAGSVKNSLRKINNLNPIAKSPPADVIVGNEEVIANNAVNTHTKPADSVAKISTIAATPKKATITERPMFPGDKNDKLKYSEVVKKEPVEKAVMFGVYAATYFNYAKGSNTQINLGAGIASDIRLSDHIKLSTGISIAQNTLNYESQIPLQGQQNYITALNLTYGVNKTIPAASGLFSSSYNLTPPLKNYDVQLVGIDVPINLKYEFNPQKNDSYVAVGVSSGTFINESYTYQYGYATANTSQAQTNTGGLNNFYFARTLNMSFGMGYPLNKTNKLIIEPFFKYPLGGLGSQQIRFGAGGINLKFDFVTSKK